MEKRWKTNREKPELLIPAKDLEVLRTAVNFGADAVYIGGEAFSLRAKARNFSPEDMRAGIAYAHEHGVHVHGTRCCSGGGPGHVFTGKTVLSGDPDPYLHTGK